jgi:hypothetical protein
MVEEGVESHLGGEAGRCPFGRWSGTLNSEKSFRCLVSGVYALSWEIICTVHGICTNVVPRVLDWEAQILRDVSVSCFNLNLCMLVLNFISHMCSVMCFLLLLWNHRDACYCCCELFLASYVTYFLVNDDHYISDIVYFASVYAVKFIKMVEGVFASSSLFIHFVV